MISIIVTIYNVENFLGPCLDSIMSSTFQDFELILVDDGSTDGSGEICDRLAQQDKRVRLIHKENTGVSEARNTGLKMANYEYLMFVDGDDIIHPKMIAVLFDAIQQGQYDFSMVYGMIIPESSLPVTILPIESGIHDSKTMSQADYILRMYALDFQYQVVWNKLYKKSFVEDLFFRNTGAEDMDWLNRVALKMHNAVLVEQELYYYIQRKESLMRQGISLSYVDRINSYLMSFNDIPKEKADYRAACLLAMYGVMFLIRYKVRKTEFARQAVGNCKKVFQQTKTELIHSKHITWSKKFRILCNYHIPSVYNIVMTYVLKN